MEGKLEDCFHLSGFVNDYFHKFKLGKLHHDSSELTSLRWPPASHGSVTTDPIA